VSAEVAGLLASHGVAFISARAIRQEPARLLLTGGRALDVDLTVSMARLAGPRIHGLPSDDDGFVEVDERGRVAGLHGVYAAGDATSLPVKQGGLATQQADVIAEQIAAEMGVDVEQSSYRPVLRAVLFGGREKRYLHAELGEAVHETSKASESPLWPEPGKLVGRYLAPYLDSLEQPSPEPQ
jgi:sulfide:quinone oxidoreductase